MDIILATLTAPTTGNTDFDAELVIMVAAIASIAALAGGGAAIRGGLAVWNKAVKYFQKAF
jgi:hypothetical protein